MHIADDAVGGNAEDGRIGVLVDRDDDVGRLHAGQVLDGAGDAARDVELGADGLAGLADLVRVGDPAFVHGAPRRSNSAAEGLGQFLEQRESSWRCPGRGRRQR